MTRAIQEITYDLPKDKEEYYVKGKMLYDDGNFTVFEVPAVFREDDSLDVDLTEQKVQMAIEYMKNDFDKGLKI